ncbi:major facilitator transporter [Hyphomonas polymorpha PS728]|uniref:Major facilitator transporter n=1 Tax=Hyphomonas polymorpha PS728 TaxID=1280954 RepID=A0A062VHP4_9PROT|nr:MULTISPECIES: MFS transporter [Hyphomonas]KCZ99971.1 major facilitator transporter [Hyphomonas polymorpha PS728]
MNTPVVSAPTDEAASTRYRYIVVFVLAFAYMLNYLDRQILSVLAEPVKQDLGLSDTQLGMLTGLMFALFYTVFGIPIGALADRWNRVRIIAISCGIWSVFTALSGLATNFVTLALARIGVGVGEAGCSPPSYSIISDYFPPERRGGALALYVLGVPAGSLIGTMAAGWIAVEYGWRSAFILVGLLGVLFAPIIVWAVREPVRGRYDNPEKGGAQDTGQKAGFFEAFLFFWKSPTLVLNAIAAGATSFVSYGLMNWAPAFLIRVRGMELSEIALYYSVALTGALVLGAWLGSVISDRFGAKNPIWYSLLPGAGLLVSTPFIFGFTSVAAWPVAMAFLIVPLVLKSVYLVPALALLQNRSPARYRATASAVMLFLLNLIGLGCGPLFVGMMSDYLEPRYGVMALGYSLNWLAPFMVLAFLLQCATALSMVRDRRRNANAGHA